MLRLPSDYFEKRHVGDIFSRLQSVQPIQTAISQGVISSVIDGVMAFIAAFILFFLFHDAGADRHLRRSAEYVAFARPVSQNETTDGRGDFLAGAKEQTHLMETVRAATTLKLMGRESEREGAWRNLHAETTNASISVGRFEITQSFVQTLITGLQTVAVIYVAARLVLDGQGFSVGMLFAFMSFRQTFTDRAIGLVNQIIQFRFLRLYLDRLADIVTTPAESSVGAPAIGAKSGHIRLKNVSFRYGVTDPLAPRGYQPRYPAGRFRRPDRRLG